jgi:hypothetical protein
MNTLREFFQPWVIFGAIVVAALLTILTIGILTAAGKPVASPDAPTAVIVLIPAPTFTAIPVTAPPVTPAPTLEIPPSPLPGTLTIGAIVQITGTDGEGLNLRESAGLGGLVQYLGLEAEVFTITEGPVEADNLVWWYIVGFYDAGRAGWAASNFLAVIQEP